jgi:hypothetical protein
VGVGGSGSGEGEQTVGECKYGFGVGRGGAGEGNRTTHVRTQCGTSFVSLLPFTFRMFHLLLDNHRMGVCMRVIGLVAVLEVVGKCVRERIEVEQRACVVVGHGIRRVSGMWEQWSEEGEDGGGDGDECVQCRWG